MATAGRKPKTANKNEAMLMRLPPQLRAALDRLVDTGFHGRTAQEVLMTLAVRELERLAERDVVQKLKSLSAKDD